MRRAAIAIAIVAWAAALPARAGPLDVFGFGSRETAMGSAAAADVRGVPASYYDPAGLARTERLELAIGYFRADHALSTNGRDAGIDPVKGIVGGMVAPGRVAGVPVAVGIALHLPDDRVSRVRAPRQDQPRWELWDNRNQQLYFSANVAASPWPWLQIGGGVAFLASTAGSLEISGEANLFKPNDSQLRHAVDADLTTVRTPQAGVRVALGDRAALALVYRGSFAMRLDLAARVRGDVSGLTTAYYALETHEVNDFVPAQVVLGGSWRLRDDLRANADLTWVNWGAYVPPVADLKVQLDIPPPPGGWPPTIAPPTAPAPTRIVPLGMRDRLVPHVGIEWRALARGRVEGFVRAGYEYQKSPIAPQTGVTTSIDRDRHTAAIGIGARVVDALPELPRDLRLDLHAQLHLLPAAVTTKSDPTDLVGDFRAGGHVWNVGATLTAGF